VKLLSKREWNSIFSKVPRVTVDVVAKDRRGVLLVKRAIRPDIGKWHLPGRTVNFKEKLLDAAKRVAGEETGLQVRVKKLLGVIEFMRWKYPGYSHIVDLVFLVEPLRGTLKGNKRYGGDVLKFFKKLPETMIIEQRKFLLHRKVIK